MPSRLSPHTRWKATVPVITLLAGMMLGTSASFARGSNIRPDSSNLIDVVAQADRHAKNQQAVVSRLRTEIQQTYAELPQGKTLKSLNQSIARQRELAGLTAISGPAVSVTLSDSTRDPSTLPVGGDPNWLVVHQQDVQAVVNAFWSGGAKAMMLMDQRIINTSAVRCVGNTLLLQGRVYSPPFTITALGDPNKLLAALESSPEVRIYREYVETVGIGYEVKVHEQTNFPGYNGPVHITKARTHNN